jgi:ribosome biogenesis GTPase A
MNGLKEYQRRRLELGDMIRTALNAARARHDEEAATRARQLLARLAADRFALAVVGQFSRGKSTLMNAILGDTFLPTGALPMTSVVTTVSYGSTPRAMVRQRGRGLAIEVPLDEVARFVAQSSTQRSELQVASVDVEVPAEVLRLGFAFVDTPGIGSAIDINTATTKRFLPQADAVIFVTGFDCPLTASEVEFLGEVRRHVGKLFMVINKRDLVSAQGAQEVVEFVRHRLRDDLRLGEIPMFTLSALDALRARVRADGERLAASGLPALEAALLQFLTTEKAPLLLHNIAARTAKLVTSQRRDLRLGRLCADGGPDPEAVAGAFEARISDLETAQREVIEKITERIEGELPTLLATRSPTWQAQLRELLAPSINQALSDPESAREGLERSGRALVGEWLGRRAAEVHELVLGAVAHEIGALLTLCRSPGVLGADLAGRALIEDRADLAGWSAEDVPDAVVPVLDWSVEVAPTRWSPFRPSRDHGRRRLLDALHAAVDGFEGRARQALQDAARNWAELLCEQALRQTREAADRFRRNLHTAPRDEELATLDELSDRLVTFQRDLDTWKPSTPDHDTIEGQVAPTGAEAVSKRATTCVVCDQVQAALSEYLRRDQFRLATLEHHQAQHAQAGGFCPLHTWQYAAIGSPVGISAGYARLAKSLADALEAADHQSSAVDDLARAVADLVRKAARCPVCAALTASEHDAIADVASNTSSGAPSLCLSHLALVLAAGPTHDDGRAMVRALATALRRDSEDMRAFVLKREALHRELVSDEESRAYLEVLHLLAGRPELVQPRSGDHPVT